MFGKAPNEGIDPKDHSTFVSGFVDEPEVYEEAHVDGRDSTTLVNVFDPNADDVVAVIDLQPVGSPYGGSPVKPIVGKDDEELTPSEDKK